MTANQQPTYPGAILRERFMRRSGLSVAKLATALGVSRQPLNELLLERRAASPEMAMRLARLFNNPANFWLNIQQSLDLWEISQSVKNDITRIIPRDRG
ncbi:HigA family addiction module antitoxin [Porticoccus hydrocarbonoclasticus]|uniref:HigA family addiction module antitoxin n=1 Tax=Porticoccus hydrocarbonoclasticus TaxID=1073414 RepID=UPI00228633F7|nr:HigA family addiction module antitoxin [Porticoccus hydrocarbonoclasticus]